MAGAGGGGGAPGKEEKENVSVKGLKTVVDTADGILGAGLPDTEELRRQKQGPPPEVRLSFSHMIMRFIPVRNALWFSLLQGQGDLKGGGITPRTQRPGSES